MLDNQLIALIIQVLLAGETTANIPGLPIAAAFQPQENGVNSEPTAFLHKLFDHPYGFLQTTDVYDDISQTIIHTESQKYETHFQLGALAIQNPNTPDQYTASDICNLCQSILRSDAARQTFQDQNVGIEKPGDVRNPAFLDDFQQYEYNPSFDFILTHDRVLVSTTPILSATTINIYEI